MFTASTVVVEFIHLYSQVTNNMSQICGNAPPMTSHDVILHLEKVVSCTVSPKRTQPQNQQEVTEYIFSQFLLIIIFFGHKLHITFFEMEDKHFVGYLQKSIQPEIC